MDFENLSPGGRPSNFVQKLTLQLNALKLETLGKIFTGPTSQSQATGSLFSSQGQAPLIDPNSASTLTGRSDFTPNDTDRLARANIRPISTSGRNLHLTKFREAATNGGGPDFVARLTPRGRFRGTTPPKIFTEADLKILNLRPGDSFKAEALRPFDSKTLLVRLSRTTLLVHAAKPEEFAVGDRVDATVQPNRHNFVLTAQERGTPPLAVTPDLIRSSFPQNRSLNEAILNLKNTLNGYTNAVKSDLKVEFINNLQESLDEWFFTRARSEGKTPSPSQLEKMIQQSGLNLEGKVKQMILGTLRPGLEIGLDRDLKGQIMKLADHLENLLAKDKLNGDQVPQARELLSQLRQAGQTIEFQQLNHLLAKQENQPQLLPIPAQILGENEDLKIYFREETSKNKSGNKGPDKAFQLVFLLDMSLLGDIRLEGRIEKQKVSIEITAQSEGVVQWIESQSPSLESTLAQLGFETSLKASAKEKVDHHIPESFSDFILNNSSQLVDILT